MAALILDHSNPIVLVVAVGLLATIGTTVVVAGVAALVEAVHAWWPRRTVCDRTTYCSGAME